MHLKRFCFCALIICLVNGLLIFSCKRPGPVKITAEQQLCPYSNNVYLQHIGNDSVMYWIPNCITPGDSASPGDSLVEFERNMAQVIVSIVDTDSTVIVYDNHSFQYPGFNSHTVWYSNYNYSAAPEKCYKLTVTGTSLYGTTFSLSGTVSLLRYFFGNDSIATNVLTKVHCDSCSFNQQWTGSGVNYQLPSGIAFVPDKTHECN